MPLAKCLALPAGPKQRREGWSNYVECPLLSALLYARGPTSRVGSSIYSSFFYVLMVLCRDGDFPLPQRVLARSVSLLSGD